MEAKKPSILDIIRAKTEKHRKISMITAYDASSARIVDASGADMILVGDSLAMTMQGRSDTNAVTMDEMIYHARIVVNNCQNVLVVGDMPFLSYELGVKEALENAGRYFREAGVRAIKLEGGRAVLPQVEALTSAGIPVMGHLGLTPQRAATFGGFKAQARDASSAIRLIEDALALEKAGCFAIVLEAIPHKVAQLVTEKLTIPTIGIGAGPHCDGQVLVFHDLLGLSPFTPKFAKVYANLAEIATNALSQYVEEVSTAAFPTEAHSFSFRDEEWEKLQQFISDGKI